MKKYLMNIFAILSLLFLALLSIVPMTLCSENVLFALIGGSVYRKVGEATLTVAGFPRTLSVYKAADKPFLIVGPYTFYWESETGEVIEDFYFANRGQLIRSATDKGGDIWCRTLWWLHMLDDLSDCEILRAPWWDKLKNGKSSVRYDDRKDLMVYSFWVEDDTVPAELTIPGKFFTPDMDNAPNRTLEF